MAPLRFRRRRRRVRPPRQVHRAPVPRDRVDPVVLAVLAVLVAGVAADAADSTCRRC